MGSEDKIFIKSPNLETQIKLPDSWGMEQDIMLGILEVAKKTDLHGGKTAFDFINTRLVWLGNGSSVDYSIPILGYQQSIGSSFSHRELLVEFASKIVNDIFPNGRPLGFTPFDLINMNSHHVDPFNDGSREYAYVWYEEVISINIPFEMWPSYQRRYMPYQEYLTTNHWMDLKYTISKHYGNRCALCNREDGFKLQPHHRTYDRRGHELLSDVTALCRRCHEMFHTYGSLKN